jgi:hypothetical protein
LSRPLSEFGWDVAVFVPAPPHVQVLERAGGEFVEQRSCPFDFGLRHRDPILVFDEE